MYIIEDVVVVGDDNNFGVVDNNPLPFAVNAIDENGAADRASSATAERRRPRSNTLFIFLFVVLAFSVSTNDLDNAIEGSNEKMRRSKVRIVAVCGCCLLLWIFWIW